MTNRKKMTVAWVVSVISVLALIVTSYAWMTLSSSPMVSNLALSLVTNNELEIAPEIDGQPGEWNTIIDFTSPSKNSYSLKPVTLSSEELAFNILKYGTDGRPKDTEAIAIPDIDAAQSSTAADTEDPAAILEKYVFSYSFYLRTEATDTWIALSDPAPRETSTLEGDGCFVIGVPEWNQQLVKHVETGSGAQNVIRLGFYIDGYDDGNVHEDPVFVIYEPNADAGRDADGENVDYGGAYKVIRQKTSTFKETDPVLASEVIYTQGNFIDDDSDLFFLRAGEERHIVLYIWLEGDDRDCTNSISRGEIMMNLQFVGHEQQKDEPIYPD